MESLVSEHRSEPRVDTATERQERRDRVYIATSYANAATVHDAVKPALEAAGLRVVSMWHEPPHEPENLVSMNTLKLAAAWWINRMSIQKADAVLVLDSPGARETWAEVEYASARNVPVIYIGERPPPLSIEMRVRAGEAVAHRTLDDFIQALMKYVDGVSSTMPAPAPAPEEEEVPPQEAA